MIVIDKQTGKIENRSVRVKKPSDVDALIDSIVQKLRQEHRDKLETVLKFIDLDLDGIFWELRVCRFTDDREDIERSAHLSNHGDLDLEIDQLVNGKRVTKFLSPSNWQEQIKEINSEATQDNKQPERR